jgi:2-oxo-3-hexenedioate decarboxylase
VDVEKAARVLLAAQDSCAGVEPLTGQWPGLDLDTAYAVQDEALRLRLERGETLVGIKLGLTSRAKQVRMNIDVPLVAWLTDAMVLRAGAAVPYDRLISPKAEPEVAFVMGRELAGPGVTAALAVCAVERVFAAVEVVDSRYRDGRVTLPDLVADNGSAGAFVTGPVGRSAESLDLSLEACALEVDGSVVDTATGSAVFGHPAEALALAANLLDRRGLAVEAGWIVLTGGMTEAVPLAPGTNVVAGFSSLGRILVGG